MGRGRRLIIATALAHGVGCGRLDFDPLAGATDAAHGTPDGIAVVPALVQVKTWSNFASGTPQPVSPITAGDLVVVAIDINNTTQHVSTVSDDGGNTYVTANATSSSIGNPGGAVVSEIWYAIAASSGGANVTVKTTGGAALWDVSVLEFSGVAAAPLDGVSAISNVPGATTVASGTPVTTTHANDVIVVVNTGSSLGNLVPGSPFTAFATLAHDAVAYLAAAGPADIYEADWDCTGTCGQYNVSAAAFEAAAP